MLLYKDYKDDKKYFKKVSKQVIELRFDKIFQNEQLKELNNFVLSNKQCYYKNTNLYCPHINYFIENYDDDNELIPNYMRIKCLIDRKSEYQKETFINDIYDYLFSDTMVEKIHQMTEDNYDINIENTSKRKKYNEALEFTNKHGKILLDCSFGIKLIIPLVCHYAYVYKIKNKNIDKFIYKCISGGLFNKFQGKDMIYNKLFEQAFHRFNILNTKDRPILDKVEIDGTDVLTETENTVKRIIVDVMFKYTYNKNMVVLNYAVIGYNIEWLKATNHKLNHYAINEKVDENGLDGFDKIEMTMSKMDESDIIIGSINIKQTIKMLSKKYEVTFDDYEIEYYMKHIKLQEFQRSLIFQFFANYFGAVVDMYGLSLKQYVKLIIIMKKILSQLHFKIIQHILTGNIISQTQNKKVITKKLMTNIINSPIYKILATEKYKQLPKSVFDKIIFNALTQILNSDIALIDYTTYLLKSDPKTIDIQGNVNLICFEYLKFIYMI